MPRWTSRRVRQAQRTVSVSHLSPGRPRSAIRNRFATIASYEDGPGCSEGSSGSRTRSRTSSFSPRSIARTRCEGSSVNGSAKSK